MKAYLVILSIIRSSTSFTQITWKQSADIASLSNGNNHPGIAMDRQGNALVIWNASSDARFSRWNDTI